MQTMTMKTQAIIKKSKDLKKHKSYVDIHRAMKQMVNSKFSFSELLQEIAKLRQRNLPKQIYTLRNNLKRKYKKVKNFDTEENLNDEK